MLSICSGSRDSAKSALTRSDPRSGRWRDLPGILLGSPSGETQATTAMSDERAAQSTAATAHPADHIQPLPTSAKCTKPLQGPCCHELRIRGLTLPDSSLALLLLNVFASAEAIEELSRGRGRVYLEFCAKGNGTGVVLPKGQLHLSLSAVASHQPAMGILPATVTGQKLQAYRDAAGVVS